MKIFNTCSEDIVRYFMDMFNAQKPYYAIKQTQT